MSDLYIAFEQSLAGRAMPPEKAFSLSHTEAANLFAAISKFQAAVNFSQARTFLDFDALFGHTPGNSNAVILSNYLGFLRGYRNIGQSGIEDDLRANYLGSQGYAIDVATRAPATSTPVMAPRLAVTPENVDRLTAALNHAATEAVSLRTKLTQTDQLGDTSHDDIVNSVANRAMSVLQIDLSAKGKH